MSDEHKTKKQLIDELEDLHRQVARLSASESECKRAEEVLKESEARHRILFESAPVGIGLATPDGQVLECNDVMLRLTGRSRAEILQVNLKDTYGNPEERARLLDRLQADGFVRDFEVTLKRKSGPPYYASLSITRLTLGGKEVLLTVEKDITEQKRAEEALRASEARYRTLFEDSPISLWEEDFSEVKRQIDGLRKSGIKDFKAYFERRPDLLGACARMVKVLDVNKATLDLYEARDKKELRAGLDTVFCPESYDAFREEIISIAEGKRTFETEAITRTLSKKTKHVLVRWAVATGSEETLSKVFVCICDITEAKLAQERLLAYQRELRSLASQLSLAEERERRRIATALHDGVGQTLSVAKMQLDALRKSSNSSHFVQSLQEVTQLVEQGIEGTRSLTFELSPPVLFDLGLEAAIGWLAERFEAQHGIRCAVKDDGQHKPLDEDTRVVLFRAVHELLVNIAKHARASKANICVVRENDEIRVTVEDGGVGFDASRARLREGKDAGFGLFSIRERLEHLGGSFRVESAPGRGTVVSLLAPLQCVHKNAEGAVPP